MTIYKGNNLTEDDISLATPDFKLITELNQVNTTDLDWIEWRQKAIEDSSVYYFSIYYKESLIGEIFLHDINTEEKEALIGYHIFNLEFRGKGIGTKALKLLQQFVKQNMDLKKLIIITGNRNMSSKKIAEKCGFIDIGPSWEDPNNVVFEWTIPE